MRHCFTLAAAALLVAAAGCDDPRFGGQEPAIKTTKPVEREVAALTESEVRVYLSDSTLRHESKEAVWHVYVGQSGSLTGRYKEKKSEGAKVVRGRWHVEPDGKFCREWDGEWNGGDAGCAQVYRYGNDYAFVSTASEGGKQTELRETRVPGNAAGL